MNGRASTARVCARISRAVPGHEVTAMAIVIDESPWPRTAASAMASGRLGMAMNQSVIAISTLDVVPPKWPASSPMALPSTIVSPVEMTPIASDGRAPQISNGRIDRPA